jgi:hypothetical protein
MLRQSPECRGRNKPGLKRRHATANPVLSDCNGLRPGLGRPGEWSMIYIVDMSILDKSQFCEHDV